MEAGFDFKGKVHQVKVPRVEGPINDQKGAQPKMNLFVDFSGPKRGGVWFKANPKAVAM